MFNEFANLDFEESYYKNLDAFTVWFTRLSFLCLSAFKWENLPETCDERYLEKTLFTNGLTAFYDSEMYGLIHSKATSAGKLNQYDNPTQYNLISNVWNFTVPTKELVICRNNSLDIPTAVYVARFASRLEEIERAIDINLEQQKFSTMVRCDDKQRLTFKNIIAQYKGGTPFIYGDKMLNLKDAFQTVDLSSPFIADKLLDIYHSIYFDCLRFFGIDSPSEYKRERVQTAEIETANAETNMNLMQGLIYRKKAVEELNERYNLNISVSLRKFTEEDIQKAFTEVNENE